LIFHNRIWVSYWIKLNNPNIYYDLNLENYFSKDKFDMIYLEDKPVKKGIKTQSQSSEWDNIVL